MAISEKNNILVKVDQNNLIYLDPNSVINDGNIEQRIVPQEELVMFVNLEADLIPRTTLISDGDKSTLTSVAKGIFNLMRNNEGGDLDTAWTNTYVSHTKNKENGDIFSQNDTSGQSFGIESIDILIRGTNFIPRVNIRFIDVRGKTLFDSPKDSPYAAFFHLPWPIFYLTVKGYYGKAIRYRLHLTSFKSKLNSSNGNFEIDTTFVGSTYAYMADLPFDGILNAAYMYKIENKVDSTTNEKTGRVEKKLKKSSKGYATLRSVYNEYKQKGLISKDFPVRTLRELFTISSKLDKILEEKIFTEFVDHRLLSGIKEFGTQLSTLENFLLEWKRRNLSPTETFTLSDVITESTPVYFELINDKTSLNIITGKTTNGTLEYIINQNIEKLEGNPTFGVNRENIKINKMTPKSISFNGLKNVGDFYTLSGSGNRVGVNIGEIFERIRLITNQYVEQNKMIVETIQLEMNNIVKNTKDGIGFEPTIRNIVAVILANADTYIRLLKDVHNKAFQNGQKRSKIIHGSSGESVGPDIYPWPEIKLPVLGEKQNVLMYPGDLKIIHKLQTHNHTLWPEIGFIEEFINVSTHRHDTLDDKETENDITTYVFESDTDIISKKDIGELTNLSDVVPYHDKTMASILYEIFERAKYITSFDTFTKKTLTQLASVEFDNLKNQIDEDYESSFILKNDINDLPSLLQKMAGFSPFERRPYYLDQIPTVPYIVESLNQNFGIIEYKKNKKKTTNNNGSYDDLTENLRIYVPEEYRTKLYPFSSPLYLSYINQSSFTKNDLNHQGFIKVNTTDGFLTSPIDGKMWVNKDFENNLFENTLNINGNKRHILNTPYFHSQLLKEFNNQKVIGKYVGSSYLLLNSLPFKDLDDKLNHEGKTVLMSSMFREIGASHFIPYHLILKWGSIYHRYKKFLLDGEDIIENILDPINGDVFFDNNGGETIFNLINSYTAQRTEKTNIGLNPFYQSIFHQIVNGYSFIDIENIKNSFNESVTDNITKVYYKEMVDGVAWTTYIDNSKFDKNDERYTILPSNGFVQYKDLTNYEKSEQDNFKVLWEVDDINLNTVISYTGETFPNYSQYFKSPNNTYGIDENNKKIIDLIGTFNPNILDFFENMFLDFSSQIIREEIEYKPYDVKYHTFQGLMKILVSSDKKGNDGNDVDLTIRNIKNKQKINLNRVTNEMLGNENLMVLSLSNPKEIDNFLIGGFTNTDVQNFNIREFDGTKNIDFLELYLGEDIEGHYENFFIENNIQMSEENIKLFRPLIFLYGGYIKEGVVFDKDTFKTYIRTNIINDNTERLNHFLTILTSKFRSLTLDETISNPTQNYGYMDERLKLELYNTIKSFNDKWIAGNSIGQRTLMEEFLFLDKANRDIGDNVFIDMSRLTDLNSQKNKHKMNLYNMLNLLIKDTGFDIRTLPAYVNFYGTSFNNKPKLMSSKSLASNIFGTFLEVDYEESSPKVILQYVGYTSKYLDLTEINKKYNKFNDDSYDISNQNNNAVIVAPEVFRQTDFSKSNKVVAFEVSFGDQNQNIFKGVELDQNTVKNTSESFYVLERLGNQESGSSTAQIDIGLFDIYRSVSYECTVSAMGNVMIQPTMFFYLKNIPLFKGSYWITEVDHNISVSGIQTKFKGTRLPVISLPDTKDSFMASYRTLFDKLITSSVNKIKQENNAAETLSTTYQKSDGTSGEFTRLKVANPNEISVMDVGVTEYFIPYNGFEGEKDIELIKYGGENWLKTRVVQMSENSNIYKLDDEITMRIVSKYLNNDKLITWGDIKRLERDNNKNITPIYSTYFVTKFRVNDNNIKTLIDTYSTTRFLNPVTEKTFSVITHFDSTPPDEDYSGPIGVGPSLSGYGIGLSKFIMKTMGLNDGDVIYFKMGI